MKSAPEPQHDAFEQLQQLVAAEKADQRWKNRCARRFTIFFGIVFFLVLIFLFAHVGT